MPRRAFRHFSAASAVVAAIGVTASAWDAAALVWPDVPERVIKEVSSGDPGVRLRGLASVPALGAARGVPLAIAALDDPVVEVKLAAAEAALALHAPRAAAVTLAWLSERDPRLRTAACEVAKAFPTTSGLAALARALGDNEVTVRAVAADALGKASSNEAVPSLLGHTDDPSPVVRVAVARALGKHRDRRAVVPLLGKVQDSVPDVRTSVLRALAAIGDSRAVQPVVLVLRDPSPEVRIEAVGALAKLHAADAVDAIAPLTTDRNGAVRHAAISALGRIATPASLHVLLGLLGTGDDATLAPEPTALRKALLAAGPPAATELARLLRASPSAAAATSAAWVLGELHRTRESEAVVGALRRGTLPLGAALHALVAMGSTSSLPVVLEYLADPNPSVRSLATKSAGALLDPGAADGRAVEPIAAVLARPDITHEERANLLTLLGRTGAARATPILLPFLSSSIERVRAAAIDALGTLGQGGADAALLEAIGDEDGRIRLRAAFALASSGGPRAREVLLDRIAGGDGVDRAVVLVALGGILERLPDAPAVARLVSSLPIAAGATRDAVLATLGRARTPGALAALIESAASADADDRRAAASMLAPFGPAAEKTLLALLRDDSLAVRAEAAWALRAAGTAASIDGLATLASGADGDAAINAVAALGSVAARARRDPLPLLCPLVRDARAYVRVNALVGLAGAAARCGGGAAEQLALATDRVERVRAAAIGALVAAPRGASDHRALETCVAEERAGSIAARCRRAAAEIEGGEASVRDRNDSAPPPSRPSPSERRSVEVYVVPAGADFPAPRAPYSLAEGDGAIRCGRADRRGALVEPLAPRGELVLERPSAQAD